MNINSLSSLIYFIRRIKPGDIERNLTPSYITFMNQGQVLTRKIITIKIHHNLIRLQICYTFKLDHIRKFHLQLLNFLIT